MGASGAGSEVWDWSMGSLGVAWYTRLHPRGAGASAGGPEGPGKGEFRFKKTPKKMSHHVKSMKNVTI